MTSSWRDFTQVAEVAAWAGRRFCAEWLYWSDCAISCGVFTSLKVCNGPPTSCSVFEAFWNQLAAEPTHRFLRTQRRSKSVLQEAVRFAGSPLTGMLSYFHTFKLKHLDLFLCKACFVTNGAYRPFFPSVTVLEANFEATEFYWCSSLCDPLVKRVWFLLVL